MKRVTPLLYVILLATLLVVGACGGNATSPGSANGSADGSEAGGSEADGSEEVPEKVIGKTVKIIDTDFMPVTVRIEKGSTLEWKQVGDQPHSVTATDDSFDSSPDCGPVDSDKCLGEGDTFTHVFDEAGEYAYYCRVHGLPDGTGMYATIIVR